MLTTPHNVLPSHLKQTFPHKIWIFTQLNVEWWDQIQAIFSNLFYSELLYEFYLRVVHKRHLQLVGRNVKNWSKLRMNSKDWIPVFNSFWTPFFSKRTFVQWLSKIHFIQFTTQENLQFTWEPLPTRECVWDTGTSKKLVGQVLFDENNQIPTNMLLIGVN